MNRHYAMLSRNTSLTAYLGLFVLIIVWNIIFAPPEKYPLALVLVPMLIPLLFPLRGMLHGRRYTYAWSSMLALLYFIVGVADAYSDPVDRIYGLLMITLTTGWFTGAILYVRLSRPEQEPASTSSPE
jgi:uncharacterized membrane protein